MNKFYITGVAGTGKTSVGQRLLARGIQSFDIGAIPDLCQWRSKDTKEIVVYESGANKEWFANVASDFWT